MSRLGMIAATDASGEAATAGAGGLSEPRILLDLARIGLRATDARFKWRRSRTGAKVIFSGIREARLRTVVKSFATSGSSSL